MSSSLKNQFTDVVFQLFRANGQMLNWGDHFTARFALTSARWQMLGALALASERLTVPQLAAHMGTTRQGAQKQINLLMSDGLVEKHDNPCHKRSPFYQLTDTGDELYLRVRKDWEHHVDQLKSSFSAKELDITISVLNRISELHAN